MKKKYYHLFILASKSNCSYHLLLGPLSWTWIITDFHRDVVSFSTSSGPIQLWDCSEGSEPMPYRENYPYSRGLRLYKWHPVIAGRLVVAHNDAKITIYREGDDNWILFAR